MDAVPYFGKFNPSDCGQYAILTCVFFAGFLGGGIFIV